MTEPGASHGEPARRAGEIVARHRVAAVAAIVAAVGSVVVALWWAGAGATRIVGAVVVVSVTAAAAWSAATGFGTARTVALAVGGAAVAAAAVAMVVSDRPGIRLAGAEALAVASGVAARFALGRDRSALRRGAPPGRPVPAARSGVLIMNPGSGDGTAAELDLESEARRRGIEPIVLHDGDDLLELARNAVAGGADVIGMAGGDGSQALVASVAMEADVAVVCVPAGTRNHFALDLGLDRDDVLGALDAFGEAVERRIDLAGVGDRVFVNNVSLGAYARIVSSPEYRDAKRETVAKLLPDLIGPDAVTFDLRFTTPDGERRDTATVILVSNNEYAWSPFDGAGSRARLDRGVLGVGVADVSTAADVAAFVAADATGDPERYAGWVHWTPTTFTIESGGPVEAGIDGEAVTLDPPLEFRSLPGALRVRIPRHAPGWSPAALTPPSLAWTVRAVVAVAVGRRPRDRRRGR